MNLEVWQSKRLRRCIDIIERDTLEKNTNLEKDNKIYISSISVLPVKKRNDLRNYISTQYVKRKL